MSGLCRGCGAALPKGRYKWCSDYCSYRGEPLSCQGCGDMIWRRRGGRGDLNRCRSCYAKVSRERLRDNPRNHYIVIRWDEGATAKVIADELGVTLRTVARRIDRLREHGWEITRRSPVS